MLTAFTLGDKNIYELISSEFVKHHSKIDFKLFSTIYYSLAQSGISSSTLCLTFKSKAAEFLTNLETGNLISYTCEY